MSKRWTWGDKILKEKKNKKISFHRKRKGENSESGKKK